MEKQDGVDTVFQNIFKKSDKIIEILLVFCFFLGIVFSIFYNTWWVGIGVGMISLALYFTVKFAFPGKTLNQYFAGVSLAILAAQLNYQMHGLSEMHFIIFIGIVALMGYQNWRVYIPFATIVIIHQTSFAYIQYLGVVNNYEPFRHVFFTHTEYMDLRTFMIHTGFILIATFIASYYTYHQAKMNKDSLGNSLLLKTSQNMIASNIQFANHIANADFDIEYEVKEDDEMGNALMNMRKNLMEGAEREKNEKFMNVGIAEIGNIIRDNKSGLSDLSFEVISYLVKYLGANQGGMFVLEEEENEKYLELLGCYAFERKKFLTKKVSLGQGLVGQCVLEKETIYMTEIPENYINITSGLGTAIPRNLIVVPLKNDQIIEGVIEIASFNKIEKHQIEFLEKLGEIIAVSITNTRMNERTQSLYQNSQEQAEQLRSQEEEMRQNMEELTATQEEMRRSAFNLERRMEAIYKNGAAFVEFDMFGNVLEADESFCKIVKYTAGEVKGKNNRFFLEPTFANSDEYKRIWEGFEKGITYTGEYTLIAKDGSKVNVTGSYSVIFGNNNKPSKILSFTFDISHIKKEYEKTVKHEEKEEPVISESAESIDKK